MAQATKTRSKERMRVLVCGDRDWTDYGLILRVLGGMAHRTALVINGAASGADRLSTKAARELGIPFVEFPAEWDRLGKPAGPIRNQKMLVDAKPTMVLAFHDDPFGRSKGTKDMIMRAIKAKITVRIYPGA